MHCIVHANSCKPSSYTITEIKHDYQVMAGHVETQTNNSKKSRKHRKSSSFYNTVLYYVCGMFLFL